MPYIKMDDRVKFKEAIEEIFALDLNTPGEMNYLITCICQIYQANQGESYATHNEIVGVLECVKQEWVRCQLGPYEEKKKLENGDVHVEG
jgi:hypothetical protein